MITLKKLDTVQIITEALANEFDLLQELPFFEQYVRKNIIHTPIKSLRNLFRMEIQTFIVYWMGKFDLFWIEDISVFNGIAGIDFTNFNSAEYYSAICQNGYGFEVPTSFRLLMKADELLYDTTGILSERWKDYLDTLSQIGDYILMHCDKIWQNHATVGLRRYIRNIEKSYLDSAIYLQKTRHKSTVPMNTASFRKCYHNYCLLQNFSSKLYSALKPLLPEITHQDSLLVYGYINAGGKAEFEILSNVSPNATEDGKLCNPLPSSSIKLHYSENLTLRTVDTDDSLFDDGNPFHNKTDEINRSYRSTWEIEATRNIHFLDKFRDPVCPDDVCVVFIKEGYTNETVWITINGIKNRTIYGKLLNEPLSDFGFHINAMIYFKPQIINGENVLAALI